MVEKTGGFRGGAEMKEHLKAAEEGKDSKLSRKEAMEAKCFDCLGWYDDGRQDCLMPKCPMYRYMPYRDKKPEPLHKKTISEEQKAKMRAGREAKLNQ